MNIDNLWAPGEHHLVMDYLSKALPYLGIALGGFVVALLQRDQPRTARFFSVAGMALAYGAFHIKTVGAVHWLPASLTEWVFYTCAGSFIITLFWIFFRPVSEADTYSPLIPLCLIVEANGLSKMLVLSGSASLGELVALFSVIGVMLLLFWYFFRETYLLTDAVVLTLPVFAAFVYLAHTQLNVDTTSMALITVPYLLTPVFRRAFKNTPLGWVIALLPLVAGVAAGLMLLPPAPSW